MLNTLHPSTNPLKGPTGVLNGRLQLCTVVLGALNVPTKETTYRADRYERIVQIVTLQLFSSMRLGDTPLKWRPPSHCCD